MPQLPASMRCLWQHVRPGSTHTHLLHCQPAPPANRHAPIPFPRQHGDIWVARAAQGRSPGPWCRAGAASIAPPPLHHPFPLRSSLLKQCVVPDRMCEGFWTERPEVGILWGPRGGRGAPSTRELGSGE